MHLEVTKRFTFEAAHQLPWHQGKCARRHGHSYVLDVSLAGPVQPDTGAADAGMVVDFADIAAVVKPLITRCLDHHDLNRILENPTAENLVCWIASVLSCDLLNLSRVRLYETTTGWVEWRQEVS